MVSGQYMLDTNVFNRLVDGMLCNTDLPCGEFWATTVQWAEIQNTKQPERRTQLSSKFREMIDPQLMVRPAFAWGVYGAGFRQGEWRSDGAIYESIKAALDLKNGARPSNKEDASIAEVTKLNDFILITCDRDLEIVAVNHGIKVHPL